MLLIIDNYDSFTFNLVQYFLCLDQEVMVYAHDKINVHEICEISPSHIVISPGPNSPKQAGVSVEVIKRFYQSTPILGICLGHQCIAYAFGGKIIQAPQVMHGKTSMIQHNFQGLFKNIPNYFSAMRYHSLSIDIATLPPLFSIDAWANETIMAISHRHYPLFGLQFHPESILSEHGIALLQQFLNYESIQNF